MISQFTHGESTDRNLFAAVGGLVVLKEVHEKLGGPVTSEHGDVWFVAPRGFAQLRPLANGSVHLRYVYSTSADVAYDLVTAAVKYAENSGAGLIYTMDRGDSADWPGLKFKRVPNTKRGSFHRYERKLK